MHLSDLNWPAVKELNKETPIVFPIAAIEQHGHHLPVFTDSLLLQEIVRRCSIWLENKVLFAPLLWLGNSDHHLDFPGTLSAEPRLYIDLLRGLIENALHHGFRKIVLLNGHGGNEVPGNQAIFEVRQRHRDRRDLLLLLATYWKLGEPGAPAGDFDQAEMGHACEWETSMILRLDSKKAAGFDGLKAVSQGNAFAPAARAWITRDRSVQGHIGNPASANAEKGETLFRKFSADVVAFLEKVGRWDGASWNS